MDTYFHVKRIPDGKEGIICAACTEELAVVTLKIRSDLFNRSLLKLCADCAVSIGTELSCYNQISKFQKCNE